MTITPADMVAGSIILVALLLATVVKTVWLGRSGDHDNFHAKVEVLTEMKAKLVAMARDSNKKVVLYLKQSRHIECARARHSRIRLMKEARRVEANIRRLRAELSIRKTKLDA